MWIILVMCVHWFTADTHVFRLNSHALGMKSDHVMLFLVGFHHMYINSAAVSCSFLLIVKSSLVIRTFLSSFSLCSLISYHIISYHIISYHITSHHHVMSCHVISLIISYLMSHIISYITSYHYIIHPAMFGCITHMSIAHRSTILRHLHPNGLLVCVESGLADGARFYSIIMLPCHRSL